MGGLKLWVEVLEQDDRRLSAANEICPQSQEALGLSGSCGEMIKVICLRGGSRVTGTLSTRGLANVPVGDWSSDFIFIAGDHRYLCPSSVAWFLSPRVYRLHWSDATIDKLKLEVDDGSCRRRLHCS